MRPSQILQCVLLSNFIAFIVTGITTSDKVQFSLVNRFGSQVSLSWVNTKTKQATHMLDIKPDDDISIDSTVGHQFQIQELPEEPSMTTTNCTKNVDGKCGVTNFNITESQPHTIWIQPGLKVATDKDLVDISETTSQCQAEAKTRLATMKKPSSKDVFAAIGKWRQCAERDLTKQLKQAEEEKELHAAIRRELSHKIENYTCVDNGLGTSPDIEQRDWTNERDGKTRRVHVKLDRPASRIHVVENFATFEECAAVQDTAESTLRDAAVADGKGGSRVGKVRKAKQAGVKPNWSKEAEGDPVATLDRRIFDYVNRVLGLNLTEHGQEPLMSIQYFGRGYNDTEPDRYLAHCDGQCDGLKHKYGTRMATMVVYCTVPKAGGHTNFQNAAVHVSPSFGSAIFFSYIDPTTNITDLALTSHSGCPVYEGIKRIAVQWLRYGVTAEKPWTSLNTLGIPKDEAEDC